MSEGITTALNSNPVRQGTTVFNANKFGTAAKLNSLIPSGSINTTFESVITNRLNRTPTPYTDYVTVTASGTESSWLIPDGTDKFVFKARTQTDISFGFNSGSASGVNRVTLFGGTAYESPNDITFPASQSVYFTGASGTVIEIHYWK